MALKYNSTFSIRNKVCSCGCGRSGQIWSKGLLKECWLRLKGSPIKKISDKRTKKLQEESTCSSFTQLVEELDMVFSRLIRIKYADSDGMVTCYTSGVKMRWQEAQCGHYISRKHLATRWMEENARVQSPYDNCNLHGNMKVFKERLEKEKLGITDFLLEQSRGVTKITQSDLTELLISLRHRLKLVSVKLK